MRKNRFFFLVQEYRRVQERLNEIRADYIKVQATQEIAKKLERELDDEIKKASNSKDADKAKFWQKIVDNCFKHDPDRPAAELAEKIEKKFNDKETEMRIAYYEKKMLVLRSLLGARQVELLESFEEKSIMMGDSVSVSKHLDVLADPEKTKEDDGFYLSKM
jgi:hypothetical protein